VVTGAVPDLGYLHRGVEKLAETAPLASSLF
jgi:NADH:ubiquinone oxidoreductase subunit D